MVNFAKIVKGTDAVLNCIPIVSTINNATQAMYKLAHRVDALNPVAPGLKTSIKIHVLNKDNFTYFIESIPLLGNLIALSTLILSILHGFDDDLIRAVCRNNKEVVHLCLASNALHDPDRADSVFRQAALRSNNEVFTQILSHRQDWSAKSLIQALQSCCGGSIDEILNANSILDYLDQHAEQVLSTPYNKIYALETSLAQGRTALAGRVIRMLPDNTCVSHIHTILIAHSCPHYNDQGELEEAGVLTEEQRHALIAKSAKPSLAHLEGYYHSVGYTLEHARISENYRETHFDTLNRFLTLAELQPDAIGEFIASTLSYDAFDFTESLVTKYEEQLTPKSKVKILARLLPDLGADHKKRVQLFANWTVRWKEDVRALAYELCVAISESGNRHLKVAQQCPSMVISAAGYYPSGIKHIQAVNDQFKQILIENFLQAAV